MKTRSKKLLAFLLTLAMCLSLLPAAALAADPEPASVDFVVLSTTDMHGKAWGTNILNDTSEANTFLKVATAVKGIREQYGAENVVTIDNGDLYQGTPVSSYHINQFTQYLNNNSTDGLDPKLLKANGDFNNVAAMALCLKYIGYDAAVMGNHEFNYGWDTMSSIYGYLEDPLDGEGSSYEGFFNPWDDTYVQSLRDDTYTVPVICANLYWDETTDKHDKDDPVFKPYTTKDITVGGQTFTIGILGLENTDCTRWDVPDNYPGISFSHSDNPERDMVKEVERWVPKMQSDGCDFIILSYHSGLGAADGDLTFGQNTENQVLRIISQTTGIDMVIAGHDHSSGYSNNTYPNQNGKEVLVVNGGGQSLTQSVFTATVDNGGFTVSLKQDANSEPMSSNLSLKDLPVDETLETMIKPYADAASGYVDTDVGLLTGEWDTVASNACYTKRSDTMDLINRAQMDRGGYYMAQKYADPADLYAQTGLDHLTVDMSSSSVVFANNKGYAKPGALTLKDIYKFYKYDNSLYIIPLTGQQIKDVLEWNAENRLSATVKNGDVSFKTIGDSFTNPVFYGLDFKYDMSKDPGQRVVISQFSNGNAFDLGKTYLFAVNNYHLGNGPFAGYSTDDALWSQTDDLGGGTVQDLIAEFVRNAGTEGIAPAPSTWALIWTGSLEDDLGSTAHIAYPTESAPADGDTVMIYHPESGSALGSTAGGSGKLNAAASATVKKTVLYTDASAAALSVTVQDGKYAFSVDGKYLTSGGKNNLTLEDTLTDNGWWTLEAKDGGYMVRNAAAADSNLEYYNGTFTTYSGSNSQYIFQFYDVIPTAALLENAPADGDRVVIYLDSDSKLVSSKASGSRLGSVSAESVGTVLPIYDENAAVFDVAVTATPDGDRYAFTCGGKYLTYGKSGNSLTLADAPSDYSVWDLESDANGWLVHCTNAAYTGSDNVEKKNQYLEYYGGNFTTYGLNATSDKSAYLVHFYAFNGLAPEPPDVPDEPENPDAYILPIFETSDVHGSLVDVSSGSADTYQYRLAYIANQVEAARKGNDKAAMLFDGGDIYQGNVISNLQKGKPMIQAYDAMAYDAVALGNHEFDWGVTTLIDNDGTMSSYTAPDGSTVNSSIPVLACNVYYAGTDDRVDFTQDYVILDKTAAKADGSTVDVKVAVVGYVPDYSSDIMPAMIAPYDLRADIAIAEDIAKGIKDRGEADAVILLVHDGASNAANKLNSATAFDLVLGGHTHKNSTGVTNAGVVYVQAANAGSGYGYVEFLFDENKVLTQVYGNKTYSTTDDKTQLYESNAAGLDANLVSISKTAIAGVSDTLNAKLGYIETGATKSSIGGNGMSSTAGNWTTAMQNRATGAQVSLTNNGGIRTEFPLPEGASSRTITAGDIYTIAPFCNALYVYDITCGELKDLLEAGIAASSLGLRMSGIETYYTGTTVSTLILNGTVIYDSASGWTEGWETKTIRVSTNEYIATSLDLFKAWNDTERLVSKDAIDNESFIAALKAESAVTGGLLYVDPNPYFIKGEYVPHDHAYVDTVHAADSTHTGYTYHECSVCGRSYIDAYVKPTSGGGSDSGSGGGGSGGSSSTDSKVNTSGSTVTVALGEDGKLNEQQNRQVVNQNAEKPVVVSGGGLSVVIPAGTLPEGADVNAMLVDPKTPGNVIRVTHADGTTSILPFSVVGNGSAAYIADRLGTYEIIDNSKSFPDVQSGYWASDAIGMVTAHEFFNGMGDGSFGTDVLMTRSMLATVFHNISGRSSATSASVDGVPSGMWYTDAVLWAADSGILQGTGNGFDLDGNVTREQLCTILVRFMDYAGIKLSGSGSSTVYGDAGSVSSWASGAVETCLRTGLITGKPGNQIDPQGLATRAEIATILARFIEAAVK